MPDPKKQLDKLVTDLTNLITLTAIETEVPGAKTETPKDQTTAKPSGEPASIEKAGTQG
jgi:hypothetical protein